MRSFSIGPAESSGTAARKASASGTSTIPGLVQNWPDPSVTDPANPAAISSARAVQPAGVTTTGLVDPSSP
ncbi:hypothetical protein GCM10010472_63760 [Pseudonocardia halophobica]